MLDPTWLSAAQLSGHIQRRDVLASDIVDQTLARIDRLNGSLNAVTDVLGGRARARAASIDAQIVSGRDVGPLAGVPFAAKNLFDVAQLATRAGSKINRDRNPAERDAVLIERLEAAGAILVGALNMGEYAYDFTGENCHDGDTRNPHDLDRMSGGSSSGSGAAVAAGLVPFALGSDTNGSIRVPSSFCGVFGLKPTYGRLSRTGTFPFVASLDHLGPLAGTAGDLALSYDIMQGPDASDHACAQRPVEPTFNRIGDGVGKLRVARAVGYFEDGLGAEAREAVDRVCRALAATTTVEIPEAARARAAAFVITTTEAASLHLDRLRQRANDFDPFIRDRLMAGAMVPASLVTRAQKFRTWYRQEVAKIFNHVDAIIAPATPCVAPRRGESQLLVGDTLMPLRPNIGLYTQPISCIGLPVVSVPVPLQPLPIGVQIITAPWREVVGLRIARHLEKEGVVFAPRPSI
jgi:1-carboxybiuret hydrolase